MDRIRVLYCTNKYSTVGTTPLNFKYNQTIPNIARQCSVMHATGVRISGSVGLAVSFMYINLYGHIFLVLNEIQPSLVLKLEAPT